MHMRKDNFRQKVPAWVLTQETSCSLSGKASFSPNRRQKSHFSPGQPMFNFLACRGHWQRRGTRVSPSTALTLPELCRALGWWALALSLPLMWALELAPNGKPGPNAWNGDGNGREAVFKKLLTQCWTLPNEHILELVVLCPRQNKPLRKPCVTVSLQITLQTETTALCLGDLGTWPRKKKGTVFATGKFWENKNNIMALEVPCGCPALLQLLLSPAKSSSWGSWTTVQPSRWET